MPVSRGRSPTSSSVGSTRARCGPAGPSSMREQVLDALGGEEAWVVGGAVRDGLLGRQVLDLDVACRDPERAARALVSRTGRAVFPLSTQFGTWRVVVDARRTVDFSPLQGGS